MAVIKKEPKTTAGTSATTVSTADPKTNKSNKKLLTRSHGDKTDDKSAEYTGSAFTFVPPPKLPGLTYK
ncbi:hypothetical protein C6341_g1980 [Phytophthora cactorum]|nr:hypothetical protein C6341_g1980 [Phytophthora cactorum]